MVEEQSRQGRIIERVGRLYDRLNRQMLDRPGAQGKCRACGRCCDFEAYDHRLFVTPPELMYMAAGLNVEELLLMTTGTCPYNIGGECTVYSYRFAGCRIFCCAGEPEFQGRLSECALQELKAICTEFDIAYRYMDLRTALAQRNYLPA